MLSDAKVLVADDDNELLDAVCAVFESRGAHVVRAVNGIELIEQLAERGPFDLLVVDVSMPWMTGLHALYSARTAGVKTAVIVMTALPGDDVAGQVAALGADATLLRKPFELHELERLAGTLLAREVPAPAQLS
jgi:CheY-like chemotaxis protein